MARRNPTLVRSCSLTEELESFRREQRDRLLAEADALAALAPEAESPERVAAREAWLASGQPDRRCATQDQRCV